MTHDPLDATLAILRIEKQLRILRQNTILFVEKYREWASTLPDRPQEWR